MKKLMLLGGTHYLLPAIKCAHEQGYYVITADFLPDNIAHKYSDEYVNVSIIDMDSVLRIAQTKKIDGIMAFACDPGVITASYVQNKLGLPSFGPYESVEILQNKEKFRSFLSKHKFNVPMAKGFDSIESAMSEAYWYPWPVIVKPVDLSGSKGVTRVDHIDNLRPALEFAMESSRLKHIIVEEYIEKEGCSSDCDCFSVDGVLKVCTFNSQIFDDKAPGIYVPASFSWPSTYSDEQSHMLREDIQRLLTLLDMKTCLYNIETRIGTNGKPYIMEVTPRAGGNRLAEMEQYVTGTDMILASVRSCVGDSIDIEQKPQHDYWAEVILHARKTGVFAGVDIKIDFDAEIVEKQIWVNQGEHINAFENASNSIGSVVLKSSNQDVLEKALTDTSKWINVLER